MSARMRPVRDIDHAIDAFIADCARRGLANSTTRKYREILDQFAARVDHLDLDEIQPRHCNAFIDEWTRPRPPAASRPRVRPPASNSTLALMVTILRRFFVFLHEDLEVIQTNPAAKMRRPKRKRPEDLDVVTITSDDVGRLFAAAQDWQEVLCLSVLSYLGPRRAAASKARRRDVDLRRGTIRFQEKGGKVAVKRLPAELEAIIRAADEHGVWPSQDAYLIPNRRPRARENLGRERSDKIVWDTVKRLARRAGVRAHAHALRAAFAVEFDEQHPGRLIALQELLGHSQLETTRTYLRRKDRAREMETVRGFTWGFVFPPDPVVPPAGFEPALPESAVPEPLRRKLDELKRSKPRERSS